MLLFVSFYYFHYTLIRFFVPNFAKYPKKKPAIAGFFIDYLPRS